MKLLGSMVELMGFCLVLVVLWSILWISKAKTFGGIDKFVEGQSFQPYLLFAIRFFESNLWLVFIAVILAVILLVVGKAISETSLRINF